MSERKYKVGDCLVIYDPRKPGGFAEEVVAVRIVEVSAEGRYVMETLPERFAVSESYLMNDNPVLMNPPPKHPPEIDSCWD